MIERKGVGVPRIASRRATINRDNHRRLFSRNLTDESRGNGKIVFLILRTFDERSRIDTMHYLRIAYTKPLLVHEFARSTNKRGDVAMDGNTMARNLHARRFV